MSALSSIFPQVQVPLRLGLSVPGKSRCLRGLRWSNQVPNPSSSAPFSPLSFCLFSPKSVNPGVPFCYWLQLSGAGELARIGSAPDLGGAGGETSHRKAESWDGAFSPCLGRLRLGVHFGPNFGWFSTETKLPAAEPPLSNYAVFSSFGP